MVEEPINQLLTPPPDLEKTMDSDSASYTALRRLTTRPLDDSSEEEGHSIQTEDGLDRAPFLKGKPGFVDENTTTTTTTTTTTAKLPKKLSNLKDGLEGVVAHHQAIHQKFTSPLSGDMGEEKDPSLNAPASTVEPQLATTETATHQINASTVQTPSASLSTLPQSVQGSSSIATRTRTTTTINPRGQQPDEDRVRKDLAQCLANSPSSSSLASQSSTGSGTPSSAEGYHTISTTSIVTTRKHKVRRPTFEARSSRLDPEELAKNQDPFRGFHTLFWIVMGAYGLITFEEEWTKVGRAFGGSLFSSFSQDAIILAISDLGLVLSTGMAFLLIQVVAKGWIRYRIAGMAIQHCLQILFLLSAIAWTIWREWPWVQSGFFTLHAIAMLMKIHSYIAFNGELSEKLIQLKKCETVYAQIKRNDTMTADDNDNDSSTSNDSSNEDQDQEAESSQLRHHRRASEAAAALLQDPAATPVVVNASILAAEIDELKSELRCQSGELWPANVTVANFIDYLLVPSLIYELQYPRTDRIRPMYVFEKSVATLGTFTLLYLTTEHYIYPVVFDPTISPLRALVLLLIPFMINYLLIFYIIFECICNAFAELTRFADRSFYEDWWNCVAFDEWARKWNKPVHHFLLRHVYDSSIESFQLSKSNAAFATFFLSSCVHELVMMVVTRKVRLYLFALQMLQLPLIWMGNIKVIRDKPRLGNTLFWLAMFCGPPLLGVAYCYA
ncbi:hypothetical protein BGZ65_012100 [Modicella reniformis]|uniref:O-acyltransferase n=1 Tax=Modicella reniformis TaxID=1440133 RepID=A0A9P6IQ87_9FUNG|nr:hypothetical protein BGZ65_012100 [Modicella reniformis]